MVEKAYEASQNPSFYTGFNTPLPFHVKLFGQNSFYKG